MYSMLVIFIAKTNSPRRGLFLDIIIIIIYFISISKTNDNNKAPEQPIDMRMKKDNKAKV